MDNEKLRGNLKSAKTGKLAYSEDYLGDDSQLVEQIPIQNTPFTAVKAENKWFLTLGKYRLTEELKDYAHCLQESKNMDWFRIMGIIQIMIEQYDEITHKPYRGTKAIEFPK